MVMLYDIQLRARTPAGPMTRPGAVILAEIPGNRWTPYVVAWKADADDCWCWGDYHQTRASAIKAFQARKKQYGAAEEEPPAS
jgi:hypothetical protein